jgi:hypothetical protein
MVEPAVGAPATAASIGRHEEEDLFKFTVATASK